MDVSCMTEALFAVSRPPPVQEKHQSTTDGRVPNNQYSLDYLLNASQIKESHLSRPQRAEQNQRPSKCVPRHADELLWANLDGGLGRKRTAPSAIESEHSQTKRAAIRPQKVRTVHNLILINFYFSLRILATILVDGCRNSRLQQTMPQRWS